MLRQGLILVVLGLAAACGVDHPSAVENGADPTESALRSNSHANDQEVAAVSFGRRVSDASVVQLAQKHNLNVTAVYMQAAGMAGVHRFADSKDAVFALARARQETLDGMEKGLNSGKIRYRGFLDQYSRAQVLSSPQLQTRARSLLEIRASLESARDQVQGGGAVIYGFEVVGKPEDIEQLSSHSAVTIERTKVVNGRQIRPRPAPLRQKSDPAPVSGIQRLTAEEVYSRLESLSHAL